MSRDRSRLQTAHDGRALCGASVAFASRQPFTCALISRGVNRPSGVPQEGHVGGLDMR